MIKYSDKINILSMNGKIENDPSVLICVKSARTFRVHFNFIALNFFFVWFQIQQARRTRNKRLFFGLRERTLETGRGGSFPDFRRSENRPSPPKTESEYCPPPPKTQSEYRPPPLKAKTMREIDTRYLVISLAVITLNKHTTCCIYSLYATGVHIIS